jgi:hypothetical protein
LHVKGIFLDSKDGGDDSELSNVIPIVQAGLARCAGEHRTFCLVFTCVDATRVQTEAIRPETVKVAQGQCLADDNVFLQRVKITWRCFPLETKFCLHKSKPTQPGEGIVDEANNRFGFLAGVVLRLNLARLCIAPISSPSLFFYTAVLSLAAAKLHQQRKRSRENSISTT